MCGTGWGPKEQNAGAEHEQFLRFINKMAYTLVKQVQIKQVIQTKNPKMHTLIQRQKFQYPREKTENKQETTQDRAWQVTMSQ